MSQSLKLLMLSTCKTPEIKSSNNFIWGCTDKVYNTILYHIYSQTTTGPTFSCARQYQSESLALPWYVLTTAPTVSIRAIEYLFLINHLDLFLNLFDTCPIKIETSVKDVFVIKTSEIHSGIHAPIHGELPTLHPTFNAVIILTSAIMTKLLDDHFGQTLTSPRCCPLNPFHRPCRPSQRTEHRLRIHRHQGKIILDHLPTLHTRTAYPLAGKTA